MPRARAYPALGVAFTLAAPVGLAVVRALAEGRSPSLGWMLEDAARMKATYAYVLISSAALLAILGYLLGRWFDAMRILSITDPLTGLFNRRFFTERVAEESRRGQRLGHTTALLCLDIDKLKAINDGRGHAAGDIALVTVARTLLKSVRAIDSVARSGGDEFTVLLPETTALQASAVSRRISAEVERKSSTLTGRLGVSIGIAELAPGSPAGFDLHAAADAALYDAKSEGGGRVVIGSGATHPAAHRLAIRPAADDA
jgi:diguanylate cyclase (GGDEF)-like protein